MVIIALFLVMSGTRKEQISTTTAEKSANSNSQNLIIQGEKCEKEGKYIEAKAVYWSIIEESQDSDIIAEAEKRLYDLSLKILFSPIITEESIKYTVVKGDALSKIAKKFNTTVELLMKSNQLASDVIRPGMELKISQANYSIVVDRSQNLLLLKSNDDILKTYRVSTGKDYSTPLGSFQIINKLIKPTWYTAGAVVSPDSPENILGSRWMGISRQGYGIHGTTQPESLGMHITAGCVRMLNGDVEELYAIVPTGTKVTIVD